MMTDDQKSKVAELKAAIAASAPATGGASQEVRAAALELRDELRQEGTTARVLARPRWDFGRVLEALARGEDPRSDLSRSVGSKGYHPGALAPPAP